MPTKTTNNITETEASVDSLKFAHNRLINIHEIITEEQWLNMMLDWGNIYAKSFCQLYGNSAEQIEALILQQSNTWYWNWWRYKWMHDDWHFITNKIQHTQMSYAQYKSYLLCSETLEQDLLGLIESRNILKP
jgi:hypothetical protein